MAPPHAEQARMSSPKVRFNSSTNGRYAPRRGDGSGSTSGFSGAVLAPPWSASRLGGSALGGSAVGQFAIKRLNAFVNLLIPSGVKRGKLPPEVMAAYRGPFLDVTRREPVALFPKEIVDSGGYLAEVEQGLARLRDLPCLIVWGDADVAFKQAERERFETLFPRHRTHVLRGAGHYIQEDAGEEIALAVRTWWSDEVQPGGVRVQV